MSHTAVDEVRRQHVFIQSWLSNENADEAGWNQFGEALGENFEMVVPEGTAVARSELLEGFRGARGAMPGVRIEIRNAVLLHETSSTVTVRYEEWQLHEKLSNQRVSMALFGRSDVAPLGWEWLALHETWMAA